MAGTQTARLPAPRFPRLPLFSAIALVAFAIAAVMFGQATEIGTLRNPVKSPESIRDLSFAELADDRIAVRDARSGDQLALIGPNEDGFIRGFLRGFDGFFLLGAAGEGQGGEGGGESDLRVH